MAARARIVIRRQPSTASPRPRRPPGAGRTTPLRWWLQHPWVVLWTAVWSTPLVILGLRAAADAGRASVERLLTALLGVVLLAALAVTVIGTRPGRVLRTVAGIAGASAVTALIVGAMLQPIGVRRCPATVAGDRGVGVSSALLDAWSRGAVTVDPFARPADGEAFRQHSGRLRLLDHRVVDSGCWERLAPIDVTRTWHEFRVTVRQGEADPLSKLVTVHTANQGSSWKVTRVEGPRP